MAIIPLPKIEVLRQLLDYDEGTGSLFWKHRTRDVAPDENRRIGFNKRHAGKQAFTTTSSAGYKTGTIFSQQFYAHRIIFALHFGHCPKGEVDHINGDRSDNRPENLRDTDSSGNGKNITLPTNNSSGAVGVYWYESRKKWQAAITVKGKNKHLGYFDSIEDAISVRRKAQDKLGYHPNHGKEAR